jgi:hypothetical protein
VGGQAAAYQQHIGVEEVHSSNNEVDVDVDVDVDYGQYDNGNDDDNTAATAPATIIEDKIPISRTTIITTTNNPNL